MRSCAACTPWTGRACRMSDTTHLLRCRSFVLRTQGAWTSTARARLDDLLIQREATGPTDATLAACLDERGSDAVYVCVGSSCAAKALPWRRDGLPVRETACLGACRLAPNAHRVMGGQGHTHARLDAGLADALTAGQDPPDLRARRWRVGEDWPEPALAPLAALLGDWAGAGGFSTASGCTRTLSARWALGGRFLELALENRWPTLVDRDEAYPERLMIQPAADGGGFAVVGLDYRGAVTTLAGRLDDDGALVLVEPGCDDRRRVLRHDGDALIERHERLRDGAWTTGFRARLARLPDREADR